MLPIFRIAFYPVFRRVRIAQNVMTKRAPAGAWTLLALRE
jgi:hypothetical protein